MSGLSPDAHTTSRGVVWTRSAFRKAALLGKPDTYLAACLGLPSITSSGRTLYPKGVVLVQVPSVKLEKDGAQGTRLVAR